MLHHHTIATPVESGLARVTIRGQRCLMWKVTMVEMIVGILVREINHLGRVGIRR